MKKVTLKIPEKKFIFFMELVKQLGLEVSNDDVEIPELHKAIVRERLKNAKEEDFMTWEEMRKKLKVKN